MYSKKQARVEVHHGHYLMNISSDFSAGRGAKPRDVLAGGRKNGSARDIKGDSNQGAKVRADCSTQTRGDRITTTKAPSFNRFTVASSTGKASVMSEEDAVIVSKPISAEEKMARELRRMSDSSSHSWISDCESMTSFPGDSRIDADSSLSVSGLTDTDMDMPSLNNTDSVNTLNGTDAGFYPTLNQRTFRAPARGAADTFYQFPTMQVPQQRGAIYPKSSAQTTSAKAPESLVGSAVYRPIYPKLTNAEIACMVPGYYPESDEECSAIVDQAKHARHEAQSAPKEAAAKEALGNKQKSSATHTGSRPETEGRSSNVHPRAVVQTDNRADSQGSHFETIVDDRVCEPMAPVVASLPSYPLLGIAEGFLPKLHYYNDSGKKTITQVEAELVYARRDRISRRGDHTNELELLWFAVDNLLETYPKSRIPDSLPILQHFHPNLPKLDSPPILLCENAPYASVIAQMEEWERLIRLYGPPNALQKEERVIIDKLAYIVGHYQEASAGRDLMTKSVLASLAKDVLLALSALNADDYAAREASTN